MAAAQESETGSDIVSTSRDCGAYCLGVVMALRGAQVPPSVDALRTDARVNERGYTNLLRLHEALVKRGIHNVACAPGEGPPDGIAIAEVALGAGGAQTAHFVVLEPRPDGSVIKYSPPFWVTSERWATLRPRLGQWMLVCEDPKQANRAHWVGYALLGIGGVLALWAAKRCLGRRSRHVAALLVVLSGCGGCGDGSEPSVLGITVTPGRFVDLGSVAPGVHTIDIELRNDGNGAVVCRGVTTTCACAGYEFDVTRPLEAGEQRKCKVRVGFEPERKRTVAVIFHFAQTGALPVYIVGTGTRRTDLEYTKQIDLGTIAVGVEAHFVVDALRTIPRAEQAGPEVRWAPVSFAQLVVVASGRVLLPGGERERLWAECTVRATLPGQGTGDLELELGDEHIPIDVVWNAQHPFPVEPEIILLRGATRTGRCLVKLPPSLTLQGCQADRDALEVHTERLADGTSALTVRLLTDRSGFSLGGVMLTARAVDGSIVSSVIPVVAALGDK